jgi:hypothetical protein
MSDEKIAMREDSDRLNRRMTPVSRLANFRVTGRVISLTQC